MVEDRVRNRSDVFVHAHRLLPDYRTFLNEKSARRAAAPMKVFASRSYGD